MPLGTKQLRKDVRKKLPSRDKQSGRHHQRSFASHPTEKSIPRSPGIFKAPLDKLPALFAHASKAKHSLSVLFGSMLFADVHVLVFAGRYFPFSDVQ